ncbi:hypothetical protein UFOVP435_47 [uncultured Caudovirales phage]|uniref:Uncharacterized protein n=1 Tax=uncultured Caudovirales phage TaxID=2100421 RepID=A0A6J5MDA8_9CAUD|nr:hypothetical protein UFOVP435_47 [uncultured Caudovirales phage]
MTTAHCERSPTTAILRTTPLFTKLLRRYRLRTPNQTQHGEVMQPQDRRLLRQLVPPDLALSIQRQPALVDQDTVDQLNQLACRLHAAKFSTLECREAQNSLEQWAELLGVQHAYSWLQDRRQAEPEFMFGAPAAEVIQAYLEAFPGLRARVITGRPPADGRGITPTFIAYAVFGLALRLGLEQIQKNLSAEPLSAKEANQQTKVTKRRSPEQASAG